MQAVGIAALDECHTVISKIGVSLEYLRPLWGHAENMCECKVCFFRCLFLIDIKECVKEMSI